MLATIQTLSPCKTEIEIVHLKNAVQHTGSSLLSGHPQGNVRWALHKGSLLKKGWNTSYHWFNILVGMESRYDNHDKLVFERFVSHCFLFQTLSVIPFSKAKLNYKY